MPKPVTYIKRDRWDLSLKRFASIITLKSLALQEINLAWKIAANYADHSNIGFQFCVVWK